MTPPDPDPSARQRHLLGRFALVAVLALLSVALGSARAAAASSVSYTYDGAGRLATMTEGTQTATYTYDPAGNLKAIAVGVSSARPTPALAVPWPRTDTVGADLLGSGQGRPAVTGVSARTVVVGRRLIVHGRRFSPRRASDVVHVGALLAPVIAASRTRLEIIAPPIGHGRLTVRTPAGAASGPLIRGLGAPALRTAQHLLVDRDPEHAPRGITALAGEVVTASGRPMAGVTVSITAGWRHGSSSTRTNPAGQFLLSDLSAGKRTLTIDATRTRSGDFGVYSEPVELPEGRTTVLPWLTQLTRIDTRSAIRLPAVLRHPLTLRSPRLPGLRVVVPKGTLIRNRFGRRVRDLSLTPLPAGRTPFPWGPGMVAPYFTLQPGDATVSGAGLKVIYPNTMHLAPGTTVPLLGNSPYARGFGWYRYGTGRVSRDGRSIVPTTTTRFHTTDPGGNATKGGPSTGPKSADDCLCGDPVDLGTGLLVASTTDFQLPDVIPVSLTRTYRPLDDTVRAFGIGTEDSLDLYIVADSQGNFDLFLPDGGDIVYAPTTTTGLYKAVSTPTVYTGSKLTWDGGDEFGPFTITLQNGTQMSFGNPAYLDAITDRYGNTVTINRDGPDSAPSSVTTPNGLWMNLAYGQCDSSGDQCITSITDNSGRTTSYSYDSSGRLVSATDVDGGTTQYGWAACTSAITCTEMTSVTDPAGRTTTFAYNSTGTVSSETLPNKGAWKYAYTLTKGVISKTTATDPDQNKTVVSFNTSGYPTSVVNGSGATVAETTTTTYVPNTGLVATSTDALGRKTAFTYDGNGNLLTVTALSGTANAATTKFTYESKYDRLASVTDPLGHVTNYTYNDTTRKETIVDPLQRTTLIKFNPQGQVSWVENPDQGKTYYSYLNGQLVAVTNQDGNTVSSYDDAAGRPLYVTDPDGNVSSYTYDAAGDILSQTDGAGDTTTYSYDGDGDLTSVTDANQNTTHYAYNGLGEPNQITDPLGHSQINTYDLDGNLLTSTDRNGNETTYAYDALGRPTTIDYGVTGLGHADALALSYDAGNRLTKLVDAQTGTYSYTYNGLGNVLTDTTPASEITYTYDLAGERKSMTVGSQTPLNYSYDADGELTGITQGSTSVGYSYDSDGDLTGESLPNSVTEAMTYDPASELTGLSYSDGATSLGSLAFTRDADGAILQESSTGALSVPILPNAVSNGFNADNELTSQNGATLTYDNDGNLTSDGTNTFSWNSLGQLASVRTPTGLTGYTYDPFGHQISASTSAGTTSSLYDGSTLVQQSSTQSGTTNYLSSSFGPIDVQAPSGTVVPLVDQLGTTLGLVNGSGQVTTSYAYDPAGNVTASGAASPDSELYAGGLADAAGVDQMAHRVYDPADGRFLSQDPLGLSGGSANLYEYSGDDPVDGSDPSGLTPFYEKFTSPGAAAAILSLAHDACALFCPSGSGTTQGAGAGGDGDANGVNTAETGAATEASAETSLSGDATVADDLGTAASVLQGVQSGLDLVNTAESCWTGASSCPDDVGSEVQDSASELLSLDPLQAAGLSYIVDDFEVFFNFYDALNATGELSANGWENGVDALCDSVVDGGPVNLFLLGAQ